MENRHITVKGVICVIKHEKQLFYPVGVEWSNPWHAVLLQGIL